uniref:Putative secreted salivary peptide of 9.57 kDa n=1 Tax=Ixodes pacificus TaxID=29930 RepID=Q6B881_IXOPA|nr:putative secreted salivary peptide of 9.57 kDa [Ixodes pacificus]
MRTIVLLAVIALGGVSLIMGDTNYRHHYGVSFENDTCKYRNQTLKDGGFETLQYPCELWLLQCNQQKHLLLKGCNVQHAMEVASTSTTLITYWPRCCPRYPIC